MMSIMKGALVAGAGLLALASHAAEAAVFTVTTGGTVGFGVDRGLFGAVAERDVTGLAYEMSMTIDTAGTAVTTDPTSFAALGAGPTAAFVAITVDGVTFSGFTGGDALDALISGQLSIDGFGIDGIHSQAEGVAADGQFTSAFQLVYSLVNPFVSGGGDPTQTVNYTVDPAVDITAGQFLSTGPQGEAELFLVPEWITLNAAVIDVAEPGAIALLGLGLFALGMLRRRG